MAKETMPFGFGKKEFVALRTAIRAKPKKGKGWHLHSIEHSNARKGVKKPKNCKLRFEEETKVRELLPEYRGEATGELTLSELKEYYPPLYDKIKYWEELGKGILKKKKGIY